MQLFEAKVLILELMSHLQTIGQSLHFTLMLYLAAILCSNIDVMYQNITRELLLVT